MLQLSANELQRIKNTVHDKEIFLVVNTICNYFSWKPRNSSRQLYLYDYHSLPCAPSSNSITQAVDDAVRSLEIKRNSFCLLLSDAANYMEAASVILSVS